MRGVNVNMKQENKFSIPNLITSARILGSIGLMFTDSMSVSFLVLYSLCGISDVVDGWIARATKSSSEFGAKLDSIADILFYSVMAVHFFPFLIRELPVALWCVAGGVIFARALIYLFVAVKYHRFAAIHTYLNKATGFLLFVMPYFILCAATVFICTILAIVSVVATIEELLIHLCSKEYRADVRTIFQLRRKVSADVNVA